MLTLRSKAKKPNSLSLMMGAPSDPPNTCRLYGDAIARLIAVSRNYIERSQAMNPRYTCLIASLFRMRQILIGQLTHRHTAGRFRRIAWRTHHQDKLFGFFVWSVSVSIRV